jgi:hypothetical protein
LNGVRPDHLPRETRELLSLILLEQFYGQTMYPIFSTLPVVIQKIGIGLY